MLVCEAYSRSLTDGRWRFTLEAADGELILDAEDHELGDLNRLTLLAAVRGLESLEGPSAVTLLSNNRYLIRSLSNSLPRWRQNNFRWEHFGRRIEVQHADLWRRVDHALAIHRVQACLVSSCLVSHGHDRAAAGGGSRQTTPNQARYRIDSPAGEANDAAAPLRRARSVVPAPSTRLRRLINGDAVPAPSQSGTRRRGRFTAEDLQSP
nr:ribonuclease HI [Rhodopirellula sp. JC639]